VAAFAVARAVARATAKAATKPASSCVTSDQVVVVGNNAAGVRVAGLLAARGKKVTLVTQAEGGMPAEKAALLDTAGVSVLAGASLTRLEGGPGRFSLTVSKAGEQLDLPAGALVLAESQDSEYCQADHGFELGLGIYSMTGFSCLLNSESTVCVPRLRGRRVGFMVDVSSEHSKRYVTWALDLAKDVVTRFGGEAYVFCRDVKVAGKGLEAKYRQAREAGVLVIKKEGRPFSVSTEEDALVVSCHLPSLGGRWSEQPIRLPLDILVVDERRVPSEALVGAAKVLGLSPVQPDNVRFSGVSSARVGIFVVGEARADLDDYEQALDAYQAADEIERFLSCVDTSDKVAVDAALCARCLTCVRLCPFGAISIDSYSVSEKSAARVDGSKCKGCGVCASACPARAISVIAYTDEEFLAELASSGEGAL